MSNHAVTASMTHLRRVSAVQRVDVASWSPKLRDADRLLDGIPLPTVVWLPPADVALFEQLVFGNSSKPLSGGDQVTVNLESSASSSERVGAHIGDRIANTLRHLSQVRGL
jgi:hypothetical protein